MCLLRCRTISGSRYWSALNCWAIERKHKDKTTACVVSRTLHAVKTVCVCVWVGWCGWLSRLAVSFNSTVKNNFTRTVPSSLSDTAFGQTKCHHCQSVFLKLNAKSSPPQLFFFFLQGFVTRHLECHLETISSCYQTTKISNAKN